MRGPGPGRTVAARFRTIFDLAAGDIDTRAVVIGNTEQSIGAQYILRRMGFWYWLFRLRGLLDIQQPARFRHGAASGRRWDYRTAIHHPGAGASPDIHLLELLEAPSGERQSMAIASFLVRAGLGQGLDSNRIAVVEPLLLANRIAVIRFS